MRRRDANERQRGKGGTFLFVVPFSLCLMASAAAAPASPAEVDRLLHALGMAADSPMFTQAFEPEIQALAQKRPELLLTTDLDCVQRQLRDAVYGELRMGVVESLGDEGGQLIGQWNRFMQTPAGALLAAGFGGNDEAAVLAQAEAMSAAEQREGERFMNSPAALRLFRVFQGSGALRPETREKLPEMIQQCGAFTGLDESS